MPRCRVVYTLTGRIDVEVDPSEEEGFEEILDKVVEEETCPNWLHNLLLSGVSLKDIEVNSIRFSGEEPAPEEELDFDFD